MKCQVLEHLAVVPNIDTIQHSTFNPSHSSHTPLRPGHVPSRLGLSFSSCEVTLISNSPTTTRRSRYTGNLTGPQLLQDVRLCDVSRPWGTVCDRRREANSACSPSVPASSCAQPTRISTDWFLTWHSCAPRLWDNAAVWPRCTGARAELLPSPTISATSGSGTGRHGWAGCTNGGHGAGFGERRSR